MEALPTTPGTEVFDAYGDDRHEGHLHFDRAARVWREPTDVHYELVATSDLDLSERRCA